MAKRRLVLLPSGAGGSATGATVAARGPSPVGRTNVRKTAAMRLVEARHGQPLDRVLATLLGKGGGVQPLADHLGIDLATAWRWLGLFSLSGPSSTLRPGPPL